MEQDYENKVYKLPNYVLNHINTEVLSTSGGEDLNRANWLLRNKAVKYGELKRLKHDLEQSRGVNPKQYELWGGDDMVSFIERTLNQERDANERSKEIKREVNVDLNLGTKPFKTPQLTEDEEKEDEFHENALAIIVNDDRQILLLKRSEAPDIWQPNKWALVGGRVEKGESPTQAVQREIYEETKLVVEKFKEKFTIQRNPNSIEYIFIAKYEGDPYSIELNEEHTAYGWFTPEEMEFKDHVPNLIEYVKLAFKNYD